jgi:hypothetical protein
VQASEVKLCFFLGFPLGNFCLGAFLNVSEDFLWVFIEVYVESELCHNRMGFKTLGLLEGARVESNVRI